MAGATSRITVEIGGKLAASLTSSLRAAQAQVSSFSRNVNRTINDAATAGAKGFKGMLRNDAFQIAAAGAASIGLALGQSVRTAAKFETSLTEIGKVAGSSQSELKQLGAQLSALSARNMTNLAPSVLAEGVQDLVAQGLNLKDAVASMEALGKVATATGSELTDVTKTGFQLQNALKIRPTELKATFDALAFAGKAGAFELKDMAQFMPTIASSAAKLGVDGKKGAVSLAAMMQMVRKDAPDSAQAATRLTDAFEKMMSPTVAKGFSEFGVNIESVMKGAMAKGINPMEAALDKLQQATKGDPFKIAQIFGDKEARAGVTSLLKYRQEYEKLKADAGGSAAAGTVEQDYLKSINTLNGNLNTFKATTERLGIALGNALLPAISTIAKAITPMVEGFAALAEKAPLLTNTLVGVGAAFTALVAAAPFIASFIEILGALKMAIATTSLGATIAGWAGAIGPAIAAITGPIGLTIAAIVGIGTALVVAYQKVEWFRNGVNAIWRGIVQVFQGALTYIGGAWKVLVGILTGDAKLAKEGVAQAFSGLRQVFGTIVEGIKTVWSGFASFIGGLVQRVVGFFQQHGATILAVMFPIPAAILGAFGALPPGTQSIFNQVVAYIRSVPGMLVNVGRAIIDTIINGIKARASALVGTVKSTFAEVRKMMPSSDAKEGPFKYLTASGKSIITTMADGVHEASPRLHGAIHTAASHGLRGMDRARANYQPKPLSGGQGLPQIAGVSAPIASQPFIPQYPGSSVAPQVAAPAPAMAMAGGGTMGMTMSPTININVAGSSASAQEIADQVRYAFQDILGQAESSVRAFLND